MKALIAEDDFINRRVMQLFLASYGKCDVADNGRSALNMYRDAHVNRKPYSLVCLDGGLPEMDGQALLQEIRRFEKANAILGRDGARIRRIPGKRLSLRHSGTNVTDLCSNRSESANLFIFSMNRGLCGNEFQAVLRVLFINVASLTFPDFLPANA